MVIEAIIIISAVTAVVSTIYVLRIPKRTKKKEIAIEALSTLWTKHKNITLSIEELVSIWRASNLQDKGEEIEVKYNHPDIQEFYLKYVKDRTYANSPAGRLIIAILKLLDDEGDCPSVVNIKGEPEGLLAKNTYEALAHIPLYRHSLNVAEQMIIAFRNSASMLPKVLITALGHDLGKLPSARKKLYSMGDHPLISITILEGMEGYKELSFKDEISKAIIEHHRVTKGLLSEKLKEADHAARRIEMSLVSQEILSDTSEKVSLKSDINDKSKEESREENDGSIQSQSIFTTAEENAPDTNIFSPPSSQGTSDKIPKEIPLEWFDAEKFLGELKKYINRLWGERWSAFSMPNGYIYFQTGVLEEVAKKLGENDSSIALMDTSREMKQSIMFSIVQRLKREKDAIARGLIKDNYFGGKFTITMSNGKTIEGYYTPFVVEAFNEKVSFFEALKQKKLKEIVNVEPSVRVTP